MELNPFGFPPIPLKQPPTLLEASRDVLVHNYDKLKPAIFRYASPRVILSVLTKARLQDKCKTLLRPEDFKNGDLLFKLIGIESNRRELHQVFSDAVIKFPKILKVICKTFRAQCDKYIASPDVALSHLPSRIAKVEQLTLVARQTSAFLRESGRFPEASAFLRDGLRTLETVTGRYCVRDFVETWGESSLRDNNKLTVLVGDNIPKFQHPAENLDQKWALHLWLEMSCHLLACFTNAGDASGAMNTLADIKHKIDQNKDLELPASLHCLFHCEATNYCVWMRRLDAAKEHSKMALTRVAELTSDFDEELILFNLVKKDGYHCEDSERTINLPLLMVDTLRHAGRAYLDLRELKEAQVLLLKALNTARQYMGEESVIYALCLADVGSFLFYRDRHYFAYQFHQMALEIVGDYLDGNKSFIQARLWSRLANVQRVIELLTPRALKLEEADNSADTALQLMGVLRVPEDHCSRILAHSVKGLCLLDSFIVDHLRVNFDNLRTAEGHLKMAIDLTRRVHGDKSYAASLLMMAYGKVYQMRCQYKRARNLIYQAVRMMEEFTTEDDLELANAKSTLAAHCIYFETIPDLALDYYHSAEQIVLKAHGISYSWLKMYYKGMEKCYREQKDFRNMDATRDRYRDAVNAHNLAATIGRTKSIEEEVIVDEFALSEVVEFVTNDIEPAIEIVLR